MDHRSPVFSLCFSADRNNLLSGDSEGIIKIRPFEIPIDDKLKELEHVSYQIPIGENIPPPPPTNAYSVIKTLGHSDAVTSIKLTSDGKYLVSASCDKTVKIWDFYQGNLIRTMRGHSSWIIFVFITPDDEMIISSDLKGTIKIWDFKTGKELYSIKSYEEGEIPIVITHDGDLLITGSIDDEIALWDMNNFSRLKGITVQNDSHLSYINSLLVTADDNLLIAVSNGNKITLWDLKQKKLIKTIELEESINCLDFSEDNNTIIASVWDGTIKFIDLSTGQIIKEIVEKSQYVRIGRLSPEQDLLLSFAGDDGDGEFYIRDVSSGDVKQRFYDEGEIKDLIFSNDGNYVVSASDDPTIKVWDIKTGKIVQAFERAEGNLRSICISNDGKKVLSSIGNNIVDVWELPDGSLKNQLKGHNSNIRDIKVSSDKVITLSFDSEIRIWDLESGMCLKSYKNLYQTTNNNSPRTIFNRIFSLAFSEDSKYFATGTESGIVTLWESDSGKLINSFRFKEHDPKKIGDFKWVSKIDIDPQGIYIAAGCQDGTVRVWMIETGELIIDKPVFASGMRVTHVQFTKDSTFIGASALNSVLKLWNLKTGELIRFAGYHEDYITTFNFSFDNKLIITGSNDNKILVRDLEQSTIYGPFQLSSAVKFAVIIPESYLLLGADNNGEIFIWDFREKEHNADVKGEINGYEVYKNVDEETTEIPTPHELPDSISVLTSPHQTVLDASKGKISELFINRNQKHEENGKLLEHNQSIIIGEIERLIEKKLPFVNQVDFGTHGIRIENGNITELGLISCGISEIPLNISKLGTLKKLIVRDQNLLLVPESIGELTNLESLSICGFINNNKLKTLPESIGMLDSLEELILENNSLNSLPESIGGLKKL
jgi:WD40 repeat protein